MRWFAACMLGGALAAQDGRLRDLVASDWRLRNDAAAALAAVPDHELDVPGLIGVLRSSWDGTTLMPEPRGLYGGRLSTPADPLVQVRAEAREEVAAGLTMALRDVGERDVRDAVRLVAPWHPHDLAFWLLCMRPGVQPRIAARLQDEPLLSLPLARLWLLADRPSRAALLRRADDGSDLRLLLQAAWLDAARGQELVRELLVHGDAAWRSRVLELGDPALLAGPAELAAAAAHFAALAGTPECRQAGLVLVRAGAPATEPLLALLGRGPAVDRAVLGVLCVLADEAHGVGEQLLPFLHDPDRVRRERALAVLATGVVRPEARAPLAAALLPLLTAGLPTGTRLLAIDALGNLGDGVDAAARARLAAMLDQPPFGGARARLLGCLHRLGAVPSMPAARKVEIGAMVYATTHTLLAAADAGAEARGLEALLVTSRDQVRRHTVATRMAEVAPATVTGWLLHEAPSVRRMALAALRAAGAPLPAADLVRLLRDDDAEVARTALGWLAERPEAAEFAAEGLAAVLRLATAWVPTEVERFVAALRLPAERLLVDLAPLWHDGLALDLLRDAGPEPVRRALRERLAAEDRPKVKMELLRALVRLGCDGEPELGLLRAALLQPGPVDTAEGLLADLERAPAVPASLRADLEAVVDAAIAGDRTVVGDPGLGTLARSVLLAQFRRGTAAAGR